MEYTLEPLTLAQLFLACAEASKPCPGETTHDGVIECEKGYLDCGFEEFHYAGTTCPHCNGRYSIRHKHCNGTGRSYILGDEVRVICPNAFIRQHDENCIECAGIGWTPSHNGYVWREALRGINAVMSIIIQPEYEGDEVTVELLPDYVLNVIVGSSEGLRGQRAEMVAIFRTIQLIRRRGEV